MLDIKLIREKPEEVEENLKRRHDPGKLKLLKELIANDNKMRSIIKKVEKLKHERNVVSREIARTRDRKERVSIHSRPGMVKSIFIAFRSLPHTLFMTSVGM